MRSSLSETPCCRDQLPQTNQAGQLRSFGFDGYGRVQSRTTPEQGITSYSDVWGNVTHKFGWGGEVQGGTAGQTSDIYYVYVNNRRNIFSFDAAGNLTNDLGQTFTYDATGKQATASYGG
jgi:YD repeat-containing protein